MDPTFAELFRQYRTRRSGLTQADIAIAVNMDPATLSKYLNKEPNFTWERSYVLFIIKEFIRRDIMETLQEANSLLAAAGLANIKMEERKDINLRKLIDTEQVKSQLSSIDLAQNSSKKLASRQQPIPPRIYQNLPPRYGDFLGRRADIERVLEGISSRWPIVSIEGLGGIGKTMLAIETAHCCLRGPNANIGMPFDAIVWISAQDRPEQKDWINELYNTIAKVLDYPYIISLPTTEKANEVDNLLRAYRTLIVVDNFETIEDLELVNWMQRVPEPSKLLLTSRYALVRSVWEVHLRGLPEPEALVLIRKQALRLGMKNLAIASDQDLLPLVQVTDGTPMIIEMAVSHMKYSGLSLRETVDQLYNANQTVHDLFDYLFVRTWETLNDNAKQIMLSIPLFVGAPSKEGLGVVAELASFHLDLALRQLVELSLLTPEETNGTQICYSVHPLTRAFAFQKLQELQEGESKKRIQWVNFYAAFVDRYGVRDWDDPSHFLAIELEWQNILLVIDWLYKEKNGDWLINRIWRKIDNFVYIRGYWDQGITIIKRGLELADPSRNETEIGQLRRALGSILTEQGHFEEALSQLLVSFDIAKRNNDVSLLRSTCLRLTEVSLHTHNIDSFDHYFNTWQETISIMPDGKDRTRSEIHTLYTRAMWGYLTQNFGVAKNIFEKMTYLSRIIRWDRRIADGLNYLGELAILRGDLSVARQFLEEGLEISQRWQDKRRIAGFQFTSAQLSASEGNTWAARNHAQQALDIFHRLGMNHEENQLLEFISNLPNV